MADPESMATCAAARLSVDSGWMLSGAESSTVIAVAAATISSSTAATSSGGSALAPIFCSTNAMPTLNDADGRGWGSRFYKELLIQLTRES